MLKSVKKGDKVRISMPIHGRYCLGVVDSVNGFLVYVKLNYRGIVCERYKNEISKC